MYKKICINCKEEYEPTGRAQKYCQRCGPAIKSKIQRVSIDKYRAKHGVLVGVGSDNAQGRGEQHHTYKNGICAFREVKLNSLQSYVCELCGKDLNNVVEKSFLVVYSSQRRRQNQQ
jgi:DNA-directed RNA polymerase subunit RPC12/RpoP